MTIDQIQMFLAVAKYQNFTKAAELLYVTQPNISRAISSLESELNMQLFVRKTNHVRLTPAGRVLYKEFSEMIDRMQQGIQKAKDVNHGFTGNVTIGVLDGTDVSDFMPDVIAYFRKEYPNLMISLVSASFKDLLMLLYEGKLDLVLSLEFHLENHDMITYDVLEDTKDHLVVPYTSPLFEVNSISIPDLDGQDIIIISPEDLDLTEQQVLKLFRSHDIGPVIHLAPDLQTAILWMESGVGAVFLFARTTYAKSDRIRAFTIDSPWNTGLSIAKRKECENRSAELVYDYCVRMFAEV